MELSVCPIHAATISPGDKLIGLARGKHGWAAQVGNREDSAGVRRHQLLPFDAPQRPPPKAKGHMFESSSRTFPAAMRLTIFLVVLVHSPVSSHAQQRPFSGLSGSWSGVGSLRSASGQRERIRCRANYQVDENGTRLQQSLRCASDSYRFDVISNIVADGGALSGSWSETSRNVSGSVSGRVNGGQIHARIDGAGFSANLIVNTRGDRQSVTIESPGHEITEVSVALARTR
jgi:hypothetical protein